jgi:hypothetical protein
LLTSAVGWFHFQSQGIAADVIGEGVDHRCLAIFATNYFEMQRNGGLADCPVAVMDNHQPYHRGWFADMISGWHYRKRR